MSAPALTVETFGCRLNLAESEAMVRLARAAGLANAVVIHSCAVTAEAERQARQAVRRARRERPDTPIVVTGCAAALRPESFAALPGVVRVLDNDDKLAPRAWHDLAAALQQSATPAAPLPAPATTRGFVAIQRGCDHRCTFCIIPYARGPSRSEPPEAVVTSVRQLAEAGCREAVLTGVDLTAWGNDLPGRPRLGELVRQVLADVPALPRLRLSSLDPAEIDEDLWQAIAEEKRLMPHLHLSVQAGDDLVLKQMRRRHLRADVLAIAARARALRPEIALGADLIAGFPTESDAQFERTLDLVEAAAIDFLHVFSYSPRSGTPAARLPPLPPTLVKERAMQLRNLGAERLRQRLDSLAGRTAVVLMERGGTGHTECFARVRPIRPLPAGEIATLRLTPGGDTDLLGEAA